MRGLAVGRSLPDELILSHLNREIVLEPLSDLVGFGTPEEAKARDFEIFFRHLGIGFDLRGIQPREVFLGEPRCGVAVR